MVAFGNIALLQSHQRIPPMHDYYIPDLIELCSLAAFVRDLVNDVAIPLTPNDREPLVTFERFLRSRRPDLVGISCFTSGAKSALELAEIAKRFGSTVVMGGYHPSALPEELLGTGLVDAVVRGEGELTFRELVEGRSLSLIEGLSFIKDGTVVHNPDRELIGDLDLLPMPLREIRPERFGLKGLDYHTDTIFASRGCRAKCAFCANHLVGKRWRQRSNEHVLSELLTIAGPRRARAKVVKFWDPNFLTDPERIEEICDLIIENRLPEKFRFIAETRAEDVIRARHILPKMRRAGFVRIGCGVESPNRETHKLLNKGLNLDNVQKAADLLTASDMMFIKFLIVGHSNETADDIMRYPEYALSHGVQLQNTTFMMMTPYPGTKMAESFSEQGLITTSDWDLYNNFGAVIEPQGITTSELQTLYCSVSTAYATSRQFLLGKPFDAVLQRLFEALMIHTKMMQANPAYQEAEVIASLWLALDRIRGRRERAPRSTQKRGFFDRRTLVFHCRGRQPLLFGLAESEEMEQLVLCGANDSDAAVLPTKYMHISAERFVALASGVDVRRVAHDVLTLQWNRRAFKMKWLPSLVWNLVKLTWHFGAVLGFQVFARVSARTRRLGYS